MMGDVRLTRKEAAALLELTEILFPYDGPEETLRGMGEQDELTAEGPGAVELQETVRTGWAALAKIRATLMR